MTARDVIKAAVVLVLGSAGLVLFLHLAGVDFERQLLGLGLFLLLRGLRLMRGQSYDE